MIYVVVVTNATRQAPVMGSTNEYDDDMEQHSAWIGTNRERLMTSAQAWISENGADEDRPWRIMIGELTRSAVTRIVVEEGEISFPAPHRGRRQAPALEDAVGGEEF